MSTKDSHGTNCAARRWRTCEALGSAVEQILLEHKEEPVIVQGLFDPPPELTHRDQLLREFVSSLPLTLSASGLI